MTTHHNTHRGTPKPSFFYGYVVVAVAFIIMTATIGTYYSFGIFFKPMSADFGWNRALTSGAFSLSWLVTGFLTIAIGWLNDRFGPRLVMTLCGLLAGIGFLLMSQVNTIWQLYAFYGVLIGAGLSVFVPLLSTVARWFVKRRTLMSGIVVCGLGVGSLAIPPLANWLIQTYDWRMSFLILGAAILIINLVAAQFLRHEPAQLGQKAFGENEMKRDEMRRETFSFSLKKAASTRQFWTVFAMFLCFGFCLNALLIHMAPYATDLGISADTAATIVATTGGSSIIGRIVLGTVGDRVGNKKAYLMGLSLFLVSSLLLLLAKEAWALYLFAALFGLAWGDLAAQQSPLVAMLFGLSSHGLIFGVLDLGFTSGSAIGPLVAGYIFDVSHGYQTAFLLSAAISIIGLIATAFLTTTQSLDNKHY